MSEQENLSTAELEKDVNLNNNEADKTLNEDVEQKTGLSTNQPDDDKIASEQVNDLFNAPDTYDYKDVKLPENVQLDKDLIEKFNPIAKKLNLSQKGANELMALAVDLVSKRADEFMKNADNALQNQITKYENDLLNDTEDE